MIRKTNHGLSYKEGTSQEFSSHETITKTIPLEVVIVRMTIIYFNLKVLNPL